MKKIVFLLGVISFISCKVNSNRVDHDSLLRKSFGGNNKILTVTKAAFWEGVIGDEIRKAFGSYQVGLPQPETIVSMTQIPPSGFNKLTNINRSVMVVRLGENDTIIKEYNKYAKPQTIVYVTGKSESSLKKLIVDKASEIINVFKEADLKTTIATYSKAKLDEQSFETVRNLGITLSIPSNFKFVKDSLGFLWLRQDLKAGKLNGSNNILLYSLPMDNTVYMPDSISKIRDMIGEKHIPGHKDGTYMITEKAYTPHIFDAEIDGRKAYETRGKWEVKNDFMAGPFLNYSILDKKNKRLVVFEGFTYIPSFNKRDLIFKLEAIAKSIKFK